MTCEIKILLESQSILKIFELVSRKIKENYECKKKYISEIKKECKMSKKYLFCDVQNVGGPPKSQFGGHVL
jgi:hypothetical protein